MVINLLNNIDKKYIIIIIFILSIICINNFYENIKIITETNNLLILVNKNNKLPKDYIPSELILLNNKYSIENKYLQKEAAINFEKLSEDASKLGYKIIATSAYRDYEYQEILYNYYVETKGLEYADNCSARPGHSEHQTGLAVDVMGSNNDYNKFEESNEFKWMKDNAHKYGFILRYPKNKTHITGFKYEPWHYRYVGKKVATIIYNKNITLEEYLKEKR
jgi:D-alanyl-D-alanine carboxypeptidase